MNDLPACAPILSLDFDGVLHSYTSGWHGARNIPDPPVYDVETGESSIEWLSSLVYDQRDPFVPRFRDFDVCIFSSRSRYFGGRSAMKRYLLKWGLRPGELEAIRFPLFKPAAFLQLDDRAWQFGGIFPGAAHMKSFRPWRQTPR
jgi:hypothetical protein